MIGSNLIGAFGVILVKDVGFYISRNYLYKERKIFNIGGLWKIWNGYRKL